MRTRVRDIYTFCRIARARAHDCRHHGFWDDELASICRIFASLIGPLDDFVRVIEGAAGDIKIDRERDPKYDPAQGEPYSIIKAPAKPSKPAK